MVVEPLILSPESTWIFPQASGVFIARSVERMHSVYPMIQRWETLCKSLALLLQFRNVERLAI
jgi:hypothetical protein